MKGISVDNFLKKNKTELQIIDVREQYEYENGNIDVGDLKEKLKAIDKKCMLFCIFVFPNSCNNFLQFSQYLL